MLTPSGRHARAAETKPPAVLLKALSTELIKFRGAGSDPITGYLVRPPNTPFGAKVPAVIALHGCGGILNRGGELTAREADWARRWTTAGYAVLFPDSFNPRGYRQICTVAYERRRIRPGQRAIDAVRAAEWLADQTFIDAKRIAVVGWSHGGSTALWVARKLQHPLPGRKLIRDVIAFYPGCRVAAEQASAGTFRTTLPLTILIGDADNWTRPEHCRALVAADPKIKLLTFPGAVHGFDAPSSARRTRRDTAFGGRAGVEVGTDPKARAAALEFVMSRLRDIFR